MYENLMEEAVSPENYGKALQAVVANDGAPGIDGRGQGAGEARHAGAQPGFQGEGPDQDEARGIEESGRAAPA